MPVFGVQAGGLMQLELINCIGLAMVAEKSGGCDFHSACLGCRQFQVQTEEKGQGIFGVLDAVRGTDDGVEGGVGVTEAVGAGGFEGAIEVAQGPAVGGHDLAAGDRTIPWPCGRRA